MALWPSLVVATTDRLEALPIGSWLSEKILGPATRAIWPDLAEVRKQSWLTAEEMAAVKSRCVLPCADYLLCDTRGRIVLHVRREPGKGEPFPAHAQTVLAGALWFSGGMIEKPCGYLDGQLTLASSLLLKARRELHGYLDLPEQVRAIYHAGLGFTTFPTRATYTLSDGTSRDVTIEADHAIVTTNTTLYLTVAPEVIDAIEADGADATEDLAGHIVLDRREWPTVRPHCLEYVRKFVDNFFFASHLLAHSYLATK